MLKIVNIEVRYNNLYRDCFAVIDTSNDSIEGYFTKRKFAEEFLEDNMILLFINTNQQFIINDMSDYSNSNASKPYYTKLSNDKKNGKFEVESSFGLKMKMESITPVTPIDSFEKLSSINAGTKFTFPLNLNNDEVFTKIQANANLETIYRFHYTSVDVLYGSDVDKFVKVVQ